MPYVEDPDDPESGKFLWHMCVDSRVLIEYMRMTKEEREEEAVEVPTVGRRPPIAPEKFKEIILTKHFTNGKADSEAVRAVSTF